MSNIFIPKKIRVGFQKRSDTFTGKLAYIIYYDEKGKIRKEASWQGWRDSSIEVLELENSPRNGYIFNKGVQRNGYWGSGRSVVRVYDPRDFEFEVSVDNLIGLLMHSDVSKRDIVEQCVFAWSGKDLVLLPANSEEYQKSVEYTNKLSQKVSTKELVPGYTYNQKRSEEVVTYIGHYEWFDFTTSYYSNKHKSNGKKHVFYNGANFLVPQVNSLSSISSEDISPDFSNIVEKFNNSYHSQPIVDLNFNSPADSYYGLYNKIGSTLVNCRENYSYYGYNSYSYEKEIDLIDFCFRCITCYNLSFDPSFNYDNDKTFATPEVLNVMSLLSAKVKEECENKSVPYKFVIDRYKYYHEEFSKVYEVFMSVLSKNGFGGISYVLKNGSIIKRS